MRTRRARPLFVLVGVVAVATVTGMYACNVAAEKTRASGFVSGAGRVEASEVAVATSVPGRIDRILVQEGQSVRAGQVVAHMQVQSLVAERTEASARHKHALYLAASAEADVLLRETQTQAADVAVQHCESEFQAIVQRLSSAVTMLDKGAGQWRSSKTFAPRRAMSPPSPRRPMRSWLPHAWPSSRHGSTRRVRVQAWRLPKRPFDALRPLSLTRR